MAPVSFCRDPTDPSSISCLWSYYTVPGSSWNFFPRLVVNHFFKEFKFKEVFEGIGFSLWEAIEEYKIECSRVK